MQVYHWFLDFFFFCFFAVFYSKIVHNQKIWLKSSPSEILSFCIRIQDKTLSKVQLGLQPSEKTWDKCRLSGNPTTHLPRRQKITCRGDLCSRVQMLHLQSHGQRHGTPLSQVDPYVCPHVLPKKPFFNPKAITSVSHYRITTLIPIGTTKGLWDKSHITKLKGFAKWSFAEPEKEPPPPPDQCSFIPPLQGQLKFFKRHLPRVGQR